MGWSLYLDTLQLCSMRVVHGLQGQRSPCLMVACLLYPYQQTEKMDDPIKPAEHISHETGREAVDVSTQMPLLEQGTYHLI